MQILCVHFRCTPAIVTVQYDTHVYGVTQRDVGIGVMTGLLLLDLLVRFQDRLHVLVVRLEAEEVYDDLLDAFAVDALLQLLRLLVVIVAEGQCRSDTLDQVLPAEAKVPAHRHGPEQAILLLQLAERLTSHAVRVVRDIRVLEPGDGGVDIARVLLLSEAVLLAESEATLVERTDNDALDIGVRDGSSDGVVTLEVAEIGSDGMTAAVKVSLAGTQTC